MNNPKTLANWMAVGVPLLIGALKQLEQGWSMLGWLFAAGYYLCVFFWTLSFVLFDFLPVPRHNSVRL